MAMAQSYHSTSELGAAGLSNHFLIAMPNLRDPIFAHTITYLCDHSAEGALGIVINHPLNLTLGEIFHQLQLSDSAPIARQEVLSGGPVQMDRGFVLHPTDEKKWESTIKISSEISLTASKDILIDMANDKGPGKALVALGYAGWGPGQLEDEITANSWLTVPADAHVLFDTPCEQRWATASKRLGIDLNLIHSTAGHA